VAAVGREFDFRIVTLDRDFGEKLPYPGIVTNRWVRVGHADVMYLRPGLRGLLGEWALLRSVDENTVLYLNSFFARRSSMLAVLMRWLNLCRPRCLVLAPRGEFSLGALQFKHTRKRLYIGIARWLGLYDGLIWQASSEFEAVDIKRQFPEAMNVNAASAIPDAHMGRKIVEISCVAEASDLLRADPEARLGPLRRKVPGELRVVFISRISRSKNLTGALRLLAGVSGDVSFDMYGPAEDVAYWEECQDLIAALPANIKARYGGQLAHERVGQVLAEHDLFLLPTFGENFGHVISEALTAGCPALISDKTPWRNLEAEGVGWDIPLSETERFRTILQQCVDGNDEWHAALSTRARAYAAVRASDPISVDANRRLFQQAFGWRGPC
jgi:glycosyltransferase involved in cell wall biosynthesis